MKTHRFNFKIAIICAVVGVVTSNTSITVAAQQPPAQAAGYNLVWEDTFSTLKLCTTNVSGCNWYNPGLWLWGPWNTITDPTHNYVNLEWSNTGSTADWPSIGTASPNGKHYNAWHYGYFEISMAFDPATGAWPGLWLLPISMITNPKQTGGLNTGGEIDMFEWQSNIPNTFAGTIHVWENGVDVANNDGTNYYTLPAGTNLANFNTYGLLWTPTSISWYLNNHLLSTVNTTGKAYNSTFNGSGLFFLILDQGNGCNWTNNPCAGQVSPLNMRVQWVHVFQSESRR